MPSEYISVLSINQIGSVVSRTFTEVQATAFSWLCPWHPCWAALFLATLHQASHWPGQSVAEDVQGTLLTFPSEIRVIPTFLPLRTRLIQHMFSWEYNSVLVRRFHSAWRISYVVIWLMRCMHKMHSADVQRREGSLRQPVHVLAFYLWKYWKYFY